MPPSSIPDIDITSSSAHPVCGIMVPSTFRDRTHADAFCLFSFTCKVRSCQKWGSRHNHSDICNPAAVHRSSAVISLLASATARMEADDDGNIPRHFCQHTDAGNIFITYEDGGALYFLKTLAREGRVALCTLNSRLLASRDSRVATMGQVLPAAKRVSILTLPMVSGCIFFLTGGGSKAPPP
ncbi:hypothetical protein KP509_37G025600 [Ceratopteris richardii]|uniref:Uncharacterized protein n=1 Tax=Ceratopteris richardii TaxID=49495 RepID=A0A8T2Q6J5_CERRI|nr:hypothetical protein KP509_37G025600 [Ceratopteris richardii]